LISARLGHILDKPLEPLVKKLDIPPNAITAAGFLVTAGAGAAMAVNPKAGGMLLIIGGLLDILDGAVARINGRVTDFGAFLDSLLDRYADAFVFLGLAWRLREDTTAVALSIGSLVGALLISYARARAEGLGMQCKAGLMERPERIILLIFATLTGLIAPALWAMFFLTHITVLQRLYHVRRLTAG